MAVNWLARFAAKAPVPVCAAIGADAQAAVEDLGLDPHICLVASPRHASVLLVVGETGDELRTELRRLHDQLPHPRATLWWRARPDPDFGEAIVDRRDATVAMQIVEIYRTLLDGSRKSEADLLPDAPPVPWRGNGKNGQGGDGMMGGNPYGRPMAMTDDDLRDGLALDAYTASFGPFLPMFPPGLVLEITLQGDVIQKAKLLHPPFAQETGPETAAALRQAARMLRIVGVPALSDRFVVSAVLRAAGKSVDTAKLRRGLRWSGALRAVPAGLGAREPESRSARLSLEVWLDEATKAPGDGGRDGEVWKQATAHSLSVLLEGLEWNEAVLLLNSLGNADLLAMCAAANADGPGEGTSGTCK